MGTIFLDLDGTLTDPKPGITGSVVHALHSLGLPAPDPDSLEWVIGPPLLDSFRRLGAPDPALALDRYRARYARTGLFECRLHDGIPEVLTALRAAGHRLCLATAKPLAFATRVTAHFKLDVFLEHQFGPELDGTRNDKADLLAHALGITGAAAAGCVMVGDRHHDVDAARAVGMPVVGVAWGFAAPGELDGADRVCAAPGDLPAAIAALSGAER